MAIKVYWFCSELSKKGLPNLLREDAIRESFAITYSNLIVEIKVHKPEGVGHNKRICVEVTDDKKSEVFHFQPVLLADNGGPTHL